MPTLTAVAIVFGLFVLTLLASTAYFAAFRMPQPPIGAMNLWDVALAMICIALVPYLHVLAADWASTLFLSLIMGTLFSMLLEPIVASVGLRLALAIGAVALGIASPHLDPGSGHVYTMINNGLIMAAAIAIANVWVQSGLRLRDLIVLGLLIAAYDFVVTCRMPLTADLFLRLDQRPFEPLIAWRDGPVWPGVGLGDTLMSAAFVLGIEKAWGRRAALTGVAAMAIAVAIAFTRPFGEVVCVTFTYPVMVVIAPIQLGLYAALRRLAGTGTGIGTGTETEIEGERTMQAYRRGVERKRRPPAFD